MKLFLQNLLLLSTLFLMTGCVNYIEYPFPHSKNEKIDTQLIGTWEIDAKKTDFNKIFDKKSSDNNETDVIVFISNDKKNMFTLYLGSPEKKSSNELKAYTSSLQNNDYLNFNQGKHSNEFNHYKYSINENQLTIWMMNSKVLIQSIKTKKIHGDVSENGILPIVDITIWEDSKLYKKYLLKHDQELYDTPIYLIRKE